MEDKIIIVCSQNDVEYINRWVEFDKENRIILTGKDADMDTFIHAVEWGYEIILYETNIKISSIKKLIRYYNDFVDELKRTNNLMPEDDFHYKIMFV